MKTSLRTASLLLASLLAASTLAACTDDGTADDDLGDTSAELAIRPRFELWKDTAGQYRFHLLDSAGALLVTSEGYESRVGALNGITSVLDNGGLSTHYKVAASADGRAYFNLFAQNGQIIGTSGIQPDAATAAKKVDATIGSVAAYVEFWENGTGARVAVHLDAGGQYYFNVHAGNGEIVLRSERYTSEAAALNGAFSVVENGVSAARYVVKASASGGYYLNLTATNGQIIATSEIYASKSNATRAMNADIALLPQIPLL